MTKQLLIAWVVLFVLWMLASMLVHGVMLSADYARLTNLFRPPAEAQKLFHLMLLAHAIMAGAFAWIYKQGRDGGPWLGQGIRFGLAVAALGVVPMYMIYYVVQPMPGALVVKQIVLDGIAVVVLGIAAAWLMRPEA